MKRRDYEIKNYYEKVLQCSGFALFKKNCPQAQSNRTISIHLIYGIPLCQTGQGAGTQLRSCARCHGSSESAPAWSCTWVRTRILVRTSHPRTPNGACPNTTAHPTLEEGRSFFSACTGAWATFACTCPRPRWQVRRWPHSHAVTGATGIQPPLRSAPKASLVGLSGPSCPSFPGPRPPLLRSGRNKMWLPYNTHHCQSESSPLTQPEWRTGSAFVAPLPIVCHSVCCPSVPCMTFNMAARSRYS